MSKKLKIAFNIEKSSDGIISWERLPEWVWIKILTVAQVLKLDSIGFENVTSLHQISNTTLTSVIESSGKVLYTPYHDMNEKGILSFKLTSELIDFLSTVNIDDFHQLNKDLPYDELVFHKEGIEKVLIIPYESLIFLSNFNSYEMKELQRIDKRFIQNIISR